MRIKLTITAEVDADDYRARLRDDVTKPSDAEYAEYIALSVGQSLAARFDATDVVATVQR